MQSQLDEQKTDIQLHKNNTSNLCEDTTNMESTIEERIMKLQEDCMYTQQLLSRILSTQSSLEHEVGMLNVSLSSTRKDGTTTSKKIMWNRSRQKSSPRPSLKDDSSQRPWRFKEKFRRSRSDDSPIRDKRQ